MPVPVQHHQLEPLQQPLKKPRRTLPYTQTIKNQEEMMKKCRPPPSPAIDIPKKKNDPMAVEWLDSPQWLRVREGPLI